MANGIVAAFPTEVKATYYLPPITKKSEKRAIKSSEMAAQPQEGDIEVSVASTSNRMPQNTAKKISRNPVGKLVNSYIYCKDLLFNAGLRTKEAEKPKKKDPAISYHLDQGKNFIQILIA